jgi:hypothetical protein
LRSQRHHQRYWLPEAGIETKGDIETLRFLRNRLNHNAANSNHVRGMGHAEGGIAEQCASDALSLPIPIDGQTRKHRDWNRVGHVTPESPWRALDGNGAGSQRVIANHEVALANHVSAGGAAGLVGSGPFTQPIVERGLSAGKALKTMILPKRLRWSNAGYFSHGAMV